MSENLETEKLLGVKITKNSEKEILEYITKSLDKPQEKFFIVTPNPEILVFASKHSEFKKILNEAKIALPDGVGILWVNKAIKKRIAGVDFMEKLCGKLENRPVVMGFLGGLGGVAEQTANCLREKYPGIEVGFVGEEWDKSKLTRGQIDILFVAFGFPKQEEWIYENLPNIPVKIAMSVGGSFDFISGKVSRAPKPIQKAGFEWLYRLIRQPWRIKRQLALIKFVRLALLDRKTQGN